MNGEPFPLGDSPESAFTKRGVEEAARDGCSRLSELLRLAGVVVWTDVSMTARSKWRKGWVIGAYPRNSVFSSIELGSSQRLMERLSSVDSNLLSTVVLMRELICLDSPRVRKH